MKVLCPTLLFFLFHTLVTFASPPIPFSGKLSLNNQNFEGSANFSFSLVDLNGTEHWRHAQNPDETIQSYVSRGRYLILLGGQGMQPIPAELFLTHKNLFLRVSVDLLDGQGSRTLSPDQPITSSPYALAAELAHLAERATIADGVIDGAISLTMLSPDILADLNRTILHSNLSADILADLNRTIERSSLAPDILADLNRTIFHSDLSAEILAELGRTINLSDLSANVIAELNDTVGYGSITHEQLSEGILADLNRTIERSQLASDIVADLNRTIQFSDLSAEVLAELGRTINLSDLSANVIDELNNTVGYGSITHEQLSEGILADLNRTIGRSQLASDILADLNRTITLSMLGQDVLSEINASNLTTGSVSSEFLDPNLTRYFLPEIISSPSSISVLQGTSASLSAEADGRFISYQWQRNGELIEGATEATLSLQDLNASLDDGNYTLVISNDWGSVSTQPAILSIATALPTITMNGSSNLTHEAATEYTDAGASANDALGNDLNDSLVVTGVDFNVSSVGEYTVTYSVTDAGGNQNTITRTVTVVDTTSPSIFLTGGTNYSHATGTTWVDPGYEASDTVDGNLTASVTVSGNVDVNTNGTYSLVYSVSDAAGNEANVTRSVSVEPMGPWTFTNAGATGRLGPTQAQVNSAYTGTSLDSAVTINTQGVQEWTIPSSGTYQIQTWGAQGGNAGSYVGGTGAYMKGEFTLSGGETLKILVGQQGGTYAKTVDSITSGGGGGSFVSASSNTPLIVAGGGGGSHHATSYFSSNGRSATNQTYGITATGGIGSDNGLGGASPGSYAGGGGGGFTGNGATSTSGQDRRGYSFVNGGIGGFGTEHTSVSVSSVGGFGGGGGGWVNNETRPGGGGGYSGGDGSDYASPQSGGGGGSYNSGTNQTNTGGVNSGHGKVIITYLSN